MIKIENLTKIYPTPSGPLVALRDVSLAINRGEIYGIIGLSGAGKSTLIRCINMLERPNSGRVLVDGVNLSALSESELRSARQKIGMIFQHFNLLSSRTVSGNIEFPLEIAGIAPAVRRKRVGELLEIVGLTDKASNYPSQLSGGQKQRVGIARALANNPDIVLCDEATSALDPQTTQSILALLREINESLGVTIVLITHEMEVIKQVCDRVAVIEEAQIVETGSVLDILANPQTETARTFGQSIMATDLPASGIASDSGGQLIQVSFIGQRTNQPIISRMMRRYQIDANILYGKIDQIKEVPFGHLTLELLGDPQEVKAAISYLTAEGLQVEVINHA
ncbi:MAG: methionine ABC transporter ATP-binding protein [Methylocystaceae bacterium]